MEQNKHAILARLAAGVLFALCAANAANLPANSEYAATTATQSYSTFVGPIPINGLSLTLPQSTAAYNTAIVTLSMPNLFLSVPTSETLAMSAEISMVAPFAPGGLVSAVGGIGCDSPKIVLSGKKPITIVLSVPLGTTTQPVEAEWSSTAGTVTTESFASISAILVRQ